MTTLDSPETTDCSCSEYGASRRGLLKGVGVGVAGAVVAGLSDGIFRQVALAETGTSALDQHTLVVLSLRGGADGLSMVVPHGDPAYYAARPRIGVPRSALIGADGFFGLHPSFAPLLPMWSEGRMAAIQAVGMPAPNRSHFAALEAVEDADPGSSARVGWLNRLIGLDTSTECTDAVQMGSMLIRTSMYGPEPVLGVQRTANLSMPGSGGERALWKRASLAALYDGSDTVIGEASRSALRATDLLAPMVTAQAPPEAVYPATPLGDTMADTARLIKSGVGVKVVTLDFGSWDMHVGVGNLTNGLMKPMIAEMASSIAALFTDLGPLGDRVTLVTMSEFGRRVRENTNLGLDHGFGNVMLAVGAGVRGGRVYGTWPGLDATTDLVSGDLAVTRDYRSVLTEVLRSRTPADTSKVFPGFVAEPALGFMA